MLGRIHEKVSSGAYYEAQQMYKTIYHRYAAKKLYDDSLRVLEVNHYVPWNWTSRENNVPVRDGE